MTTAIQQDLPAAVWGSTRPLDRRLRRQVHGLDFRTGFDRFDATLDTTGDEPRLTGTVDPASIVIKDENFHAHLQSPDFFDTERHPEITFESTAFRVEGDELVVDGNLTIKGETRPVEAAAS